jgi:hypothetical protein
MKKFLKVAGWIVLVALIAIQFFRPAKNLQAGTSANHINNLSEISADVKTVLDKACNDCHSNNTRYPWYFNVQPVGIWMENHVKEGKAHLNFDEYTNKRPRFQYHKMEELIEQVKENEMPIASYTWTHKNAILTEQEKAKLKDWATAVMDKLKTLYPIDSLVRKKPA